MLASLVVLVSLEITYIANEGFLVASGEDEVLIDALQSGGLAEYLAPSRDTLAAMEGARAPFEGIDLVLVSHRHVDHFDSTVVARHLSKNAGAVMVSSSEMISAVRGALPAEAY